ncbi:MAG: aminomethyltransferase family protein, partial [Acidimicrobiales bacterium]
YRQYETGRGVRKSAIYDRLAAIGACHGEAFGWERPNWYADEGQAREYEYSYGKQNWHDNMVRECRGVREAVGLFDQTSFAKARVEGSDALAVLNHLSVANIDAPINKAVYTQWCNHKGGIEADLTVTRTGHDTFFVVTAAAAENRDFTWLRRAASGKDVTITNVTHDIAMLGLMGPNSRSLLSEITDTDLSNADIEEGGFPFGWSRQIEIAGRPVLALRMSYVGELGWELYIANDDAGAVYDAIVEAGAEHGLVHAGFHAMNSLRLEAGMRHWGHDITDEDTPIEAGLGFAIDWDKGEFLGRDALLAQKDAPRSKRLIQFRIEDPDLLTYHDEPIYRDGIVVGSTSSSMWSATQDRCCAMGYVRHPDGESITAAWLDEATWEVNIGGRLVPLSTSIRSWYDPQNQRPHLAV